MPAEPQPFDRQTIEKAFERLGELAVAAGKIVDISVYGGSALVLTLNHRPATRDVDAVFERDRRFIREAAETVAAEFGWAGDWINDSVKGFLSREDAAPGVKRLFKTYPATGSEGLRVLIASPEYLFAMKCLAMRAGDVTNHGDVDDIRRLAASLGIASANQAIELVSRFYPANILPPKTRFGLEEMFGQDIPP
jgi:hypothetical protein